MMQHELELADVAATERLGRLLAGRLGRAGTVIHLSGELGAGKTTLVRALLQALGYTGRVRSPTYTLVEPYEIRGQRVYHLDLYRLSAAEELEYLGLRDLDPATDLLLVEWPERAADALIPADLAIFLGYCDRGRKIRLNAQTERGTTILSGLSEDDHLI